MANATQAVSDIGNLVLMIAIQALLIGSILSASVFTAITIINVTALTETYGSAVVALTAFLVVGATIVGILWFFKYAKELMSKKSGVNSLSA